jgi:predicted TIM-barrel fold metal-dependent hydrolase
MTEGDVVLPYRTIDADNHYYETRDAFSRHIEKRFAERTLRVETDDDGNDRMIIDERPYVFSDPKFDKTNPPGSLLANLRDPNRQDYASTFSADAMLPAYQDRSARLALMDEQGIEAAILLPSLAVCVEHPIRHDVELTDAVLRAFNRWLEDDWGFDHRQRIIAAPMLSLADPEAAVAEVDSLIERGVRIVHVRPAPVPGPNATSRSLGDKMHDPVWARLAEAGVPVAFHLGDSGYHGRFASAWGANDTFGFGRSDALGQVVVSDRAIHDTVASLVVHGVFKRHPSLRIASIENGSDWLHVLAKRLRKQANQTPWVFAEDPLDTLRRHVWVTPYLEEDLAALAQLIGVDRILFGSDWPHGEGVAQPLDFAKELGGFDEQSVQRIMRDNCVELLGAAA